MAKAGQLGLIGFFVRGLIARKYLRQNLQPVVAGASQQSSCTDASIRRQRARSMVLCVRYFEFQGKNAGANDGA
ncbi:hypothetical protein FKW50_09745 [Acetobacter pomorum]|nr:hypothetical protein CPF11_04320 [Acetobacter pomorum]AXC25871.1 hypothetical protein DS739_03110 [Acetobacter sp. JWB]KAA8427241.1 hypothetical protein FKW54_04700 [Acetobacter pomorum]KAA8432472.1 hypothetical protein FKW50_09745 [Acetobacter pomorum]KAA8454991.1 hypothetical protein FKW52_01185 [Acetobacter pomorum]